MKRLFPPFLGLLAAVLAAIPSSFVTMSAEAAQPKKKGTSYAFLVACAGYDKAELQPIKDDVTINDVLEFKKALLETGFTDEHIVLMHDKQTDRRYFSEHDKILKELDLFLDGLKTEDTVLIVLSGHGVHFKGDTTGYFCPVDAKISTKAKLIALDGPGGLYAQLEACKAGRKLLIANACRNDPAAGAALAGGKIELTDEYPEDVPKGIAAIYSCEAGQKSYFDSDRKRSLFFIHLTDAWRGKYQSGDGPLTLESVFDQTRVKTKADANKTFGEKQFPAVRRQYEGQWTIPAADATTEITETFDWKGENRTRKVLVVDLGGGEKLELVYIDPAAQKDKGTFMMGSPPDEKGRPTKGEEYSKDYQEDLHEVKLTKPYFLGKFEVTRGQFRAFAKATDYRSEVDQGSVIFRTYNMSILNYRGGENWKKVMFEQTDNHPAVCLTVADAEKFCAWVSERANRSRFALATGKKSWTFGLPAEAQWEYACRGGTRTPYYWGAELDEKYTETDAKAGTSLVGSYRPNPFGLYDLSGSLSEICLDVPGLYADVPKIANPVRRPADQKEQVSWVTRGGRSAQRFGINAKMCGYTDGFRVCLTVE